MCRVLVGDARKKKKKNFPQNDSYHHPPQTACAYPPFTGRLFLEMKFYGVPQSAVFFPPTYLWHMCTKSGDVSRKFFFLFYNKKFQLLCSTVVRYTTVFANQEKKWFD